MALVGCGKVSDIHIWALCDCPVEQDDYPAAHSMDQTWFAVDQAGHVGVFFTGEDGPLPSGSYDAGNLIDVLRALRGESADQEDDDDDPDWDAMEEEAADRGLFVYHYVGAFDPIIRPYSFRYMPGTPLHVEQLPPWIRRLFKATRFEGTLFPDSERIQIIEHSARIDIFFYSKDDVAYLADDQKTVRPIPGKEHLFAAFCEDFRTHQADQAERFTFSGPEDQQET